MGERVSGREVCKNVPTPMQTDFKRRRLDTLDDFADEFQDLQAARETYEAAKKRFQGAAKNFQTVTQKADASNADLLVAKAMFETAQNDMQTEHSLLKVMIKRLAKRTHASEQQPAQEALKVMFKRLANRTHELENQLANRTQASEQLANEAKKQVTELENQFARSRWIRLAMQSGAVTSAAKFFQSLKRNVKFWDLQPVVEAWKPESKSKNEFPKFAPEHDNEDAVGNYFMSRMKAWNNREERAFTTRYKPFHASIDSKKPDMVHYSAHTLENETNIVFLGSLKRRNRSNFNAPFPDAAKGELVDHMRILIIRQKVRTFCIGYLTDGYRIQWFRLTLTENKTRLSLESTNLMFLRQTVSSNTIADGGKVLLHFLHDNNYAFRFGHCIPQNVRFNGNPVQFGDFVGHGHFASVYQVTVGDDDSCLIKMHRSPDALWRERRNLEKLRPHSEFLQKCSTFTCTQLVGSTEDGNGLLMKPKGIPFAQTPTQIEELVCNSGNKVSMLMLSRELLLGLVDAVEFFHKIAQLVHRDIKYSNIFAYPVKVIMLLGVRLTRTLQYVTQQTCATLT